QAIAANFQGHFWHNAGLGAQHAVQLGVGGPMVLVGTLTILAVAQVGSLFSADAWNNVTFTAGEVKNPSRNLTLSLAMGTGVVIAGSRVDYAMAKDGLFFKRVAKLHPKHKTPAVSLMVQMVWTCILCVSGSYGQLLDYIIFAVLVFYILTIFGLFVLRRTRADAERPYRAIGYPVLPAVYIVMAMFIDVVLLRYKPQYTWPGLIIVLTGIPVYFLWSRMNTARDLEP